MQIKHLNHKFGGKIEELTAIAHDTYRPQGQRKSVAIWFFRGKVRWHDSKPDALLTETEISPIHICHGDSPEAKLESEAVFAGLTKYLVENGEWNDMDWKPKVKAGKLAI